MQVEGAAGSWSCNRCSFLFPLLFPLLWDLFFFFLLPLPLLSYFRGGDVSFCLPPEPHDEAKSCPSLCFLDSVCATGAGAFDSSNFGEDVALSQKLKRTVC